MEDHEKAAEDAYIRHLVEKEKRDSGEEDQEEEDF